MSELLATGFYRLVRGRHGLFLSNPKDIYIGRAVIEYGEFSELEAQLLLKLIPTGGVVIEAGANMGALTVPLAKKAGPRGLVYAFEPQPLIFQQLCANLALNDLVNVSAINAGCGSEPGSIGITCLNPAREVNFGGVALDRVTVENSAFRVRIERLDDVVDPQRLDLIKADVEGMELVVLQGADSLISRFRPALYVENHEDGSEELITHVTNLGYECWWHLPPLFNPRNHAGKAENVYKGIVSFNMLCIPTERKANVEGFRRVSGPTDHPKRWKSA